MRIKLWIKFSLCFLCLRTRLVVLLIVLKILLTIYNFQARNRYIWDCCSGCLSLRWFCVFREETLRAQLLFLRLLLSSWYLNMYVPLFSRGRWGTGSVQLKILLWSRKHKLLLFDCISLFCLTRLIVEPRRRHFIITKVLFYILWVNKVSQF